MKMKKNENVNGSMLRISAAGGDFASRFLQMHQLLLVVFMLDKKPTVIFNLTTCAKGNLLGFVEFFFIIALVVNS